MIKAGVLDPDNNTLSFTDISSLTLFNPGSSEVEVLFSSSGDVLEIQSKEQIKFGAFEGVFSDTLTITFKNNFAENNLQYIYL